MVRGEWWGKLKRAIQDSENGALLTWREEPLDNSGLIDPKTKRLKERLVLGLEIEIVPESAWIFLSSWHLTKGPEIKRVVLANGVVEIYPLVFKACVVRCEKEVKCCPAWDSSSEFEFEASQNDNLEIVLTGLGQDQACAPVARMVVFHASDDYASFVKVDTTSGYAKYSRFQELNWARGSRVLIAVKNESLQINQLLEESTAQSSFLVVMNSVVAGSSGSDGATSCIAVQRKNVGDGKRSDSNNGLTGLSNLGNTCYMNAILQCLSHTPPLRASFLGKEARKRVNMESKWGKKGRVVQEFNSLFAELWNGKNRVVSPYSFKDSLDQWTPAFRGFQQQDAHEALAFVLDQLHEDTNSGDSKNKPSLAESIFSGSTESQLVCPVCKYTSSNMEGFQIVSLELDENGGAGVTAAATTLVAGALSSVKSIVHVPTRGPAQRVTFSKRLQDDGTVKDLQSRLKQELLGESFLVLAKVRRESGADFRNMELLGPALQYAKTLADPAWDVLAYELQRNGDDNRLIQCVHRVRGNTLYGLPFLISVDKSITRIDLLNELKERFACQAGEFTLRMTMKSRRVDDASANLFLSERCDALFGAQIVLILDWVGEHVPLLGCVPLEKVVSRGEVGVVEPTLTETPKTKSELTLESRIKAFTAMETLGEDDMWECPHCKEKRAATKQISFKQLPPVLILHLKRFSSLGAKIGVSVKYPLVLTGIAGTCSEDVYDLYAVVRHHGRSSSGGHYDSVVRCTDQHWYNFNDSQVTPLPSVNFPKFNRMLPGLPDLCDSSAYVFFYRKRGSDVVGVNKL